MPGPRIANLVEINILSYWIVKQKLSPRIANLVEINILSYWIVKQKLSYARSSDRKLSEN